MEIKIPYELGENEIEMLTFDTDSVVLTEENINEQTMKIAKEYTKWALVYSQYKRKLLLLDAKHSKWLAQAKQIVMDTVKAKFTSETAKMDAVLTFRDESGNCTYAEDELRYNNKRAELLYYIDILESAILKALSMEKDMIVSLGAQMRAGYSVTTNKLD